MGGGGRQVQVTFAAKDAKVVVGGHGAKEAACGVENRSVLVGKMLRR